MYGTDMQQSISCLLTEQALPLHGFCAFNAVADSLLPCRAAARMHTVFPPDSPPQTVIAALFPYRFDDQPGNLSRYARVPDYHSAAGDVLQRAAAALSAALPAYQFLPFIDNSPIPEVRAASLAGLGCIGDHGLLIHPIYGSWVFIGTIVTDLPLPPSAQSVTHCPRCGMCAPACPGRCINSALQVSRDTCVSRLSQKKGELTPDEASILRESGMAWGCDRCQEVCPLNEQARIEPHPCFGTAAFPPNLSLDMLDESAVLSDKAYGWRGMAVLRRNLQIP